MGRMYSTLSTIVTKNHPEILIRYKGASAIIKRAARASKRSVRVNGDMAVGEMSIMAELVFVTLTGGNSWPVR